MTGPKTAYEYVLGENTGLMARINFVFRRTSTIEKYDVVSPRSDMKTLTMIFKRL